MTFEQAIIKSVRAYFNGKMPDNLMQASEAKKSKYTPDFLADLEKSLLGKEAAKSTDKEVEAPKEPEESDAPMNGLLMPPRPAQSKKKGKK